ncbi:MAG: tetratricopeptide repeat protein [Desulfobacula sp.]|nr:tetratricopeptide repeat protein [Desulfobacula sp.]
MKQSLLIIGILVLQPFQTLAANELPLAAGLCVNKDNVLIQQEKIDQAISILEAFRARQHEVDKKKATQKGYNHYYIDFLLGNCFLMLDQQSKNSAHVKKAAISFNRAVEKKPDLTPAWVNLARCLYELEEMEKAAMAFVKAYESSKDKKAEHLYYASVCHTFTKNYTQALLVFNRLVLAHPEDIKLEWKETLVNILFSLEKYRQALFWIEELVQKFTNKKKKKWQEILLYQYLTLKMEKKALNYAFFLTKADPLEPKWWKALTHIHLGKNCLEEGLSSLIIYSFISPLSQQETALMADLYLACDIPLKAAQTYEIWLTKQTNPGEIQDQVMDKVNKISRAYLDGFQNNAALEWIEKGLAIKKDPGLLQIKANLLFGQKKYSSACDTYEQLSKFDGHRAQALLMMGYAAWNDNRIHKALTAFTAASGFAGQRKAAQKALSQLKQISKIK